jgi:hypothetical protein
MHLVDEDQPPQVNLTVHIRAEYREEKPCIENLPFRHLAHTLETLP